MNLPDDKANQLEDALAMAIHYGIAGNRIEAVEALAVNFLIEYSLGPALWMHYEEMNKRTYKINSFMATREAGYRCLKCETSKDLEIHHIYARGCKDPDRPQWVIDDVNDVRNLGPLCRACHNEIQPKYRDYIQTFLLEKERRREEFNHQGYVSTKKHGRKAKGAKWT